MVTKKGVALTVAIIAGVIAASFLVYLIPESPRSAVVGPTEARERLGFAMDRTQAVIDGFNASFDAWQSGETDKDTFDSSVAVTVDQINTLTLELRRSAVPDEWVQSYSSFIEALENYKLYVEKTKEYADFKSSQTDAATESSYLNTISETLNTAKRLTEESLSSMPKAS
ncbi:MAG: hypothetical protein QXU32_08600 [Nitrososphaerales archaeon]